MRITVHGHHRISRSPELGRLRLRVEASGPDRAAALETVRQEAARLSGELLDLKAGGLLDEYVVQAPGTHVERDHDEHGRPTVLRHVVSVAVTAVFTDASVLGERVSEWALRLPLEIGWVDWQLTEATHRELEESALTEAVADARRRAQVMAAAAGAGEVRVLEVADPGLLSGGEAAQDSGVRFARAYGANGGEGIAVVPEDVTVEAAVQVRFEA
ncbi:SIMPL domain-containing protein [Micrococcus lylae]|uniref:DUF541 domain-containing protein n=1 Tax=Micrococcus lylae TaxID=1273 RepID=A0ABY2K576_9MICC|nr:SIMPL domain-containing protein [Micrococcus lylae]TFI00421.1 DUF541 domain-containing protein [Micrococcus lylae]